MGLLSVVIPSLRPHGRQTKRAVPVSGAASAESPIFQATKHLWCQSMRNIFVASLDSGQTPEGLRATDAACPLPLGSLLRIDLMRGRRRAEFARFLFFEKSISLRFKRGPM
jgi:hypothetical protein